MAKRSRTKEYKGNKTTYHLEHNLSNIEMYFSYGNHVVISIKDNVGEREEAKLLIDILYDLLGMEIKDILKKLKIKLNLSYGSYNLIEGKEGNEINCIYFDKSGKVIA